MKRLLSFVLAAVLALSCPGSAGAREDAPPEDDVVTVSGQPSDFGITRSRVIRGTQPIFDAYSLSFYQLDSYLPLSDLGARIWLGLANALLLLTAFVTKLAIRTLEWSFTLSLVNDIVGHLDSVLKGLAGALWDSRLIHVGITVAGLWAAWTGLALRRTGQAIGILVTVVVIIAVATWSFGGGLTWAMKFTNQASTEISAVVLSGVSLAVKEEAPGQEWTATQAFTSAGEAIWSVLVVQPWALAEFGDMYIAKEYQLRSVPGGEVLSKNTKDRRVFYRSLPEEIRKRDFTWWIADTGLSRFVIVLVAFVVGLIFSLMLMALGLAILAYQVLALFVVAGAPLVFLAALVFPNFGSYLLGRWASSILGYLFMKVALSGALALVLLFSMILFKVGASYGWAVGALLQLVLVVAVALKRKALVGFFAALPASPERAISQLSQWHEPALVRAGRFAATTAATGWVTSTLLHRSGGTRELDGRGTAGHVATRRYPGKPSPEDPTPSPSGPSLRWDLPQEAPQTKGSVMSQHGRQRPLSPRHASTPLPANPKESTERPRLVLVKASGGRNEQ